MHSDNIFRLAMILSNSKASTFKTNLLKLVMSVLADVYPKALTVNDIIENINTNFSLEFSEQEILESLKRNNKVIIDKKDDQIYNLYRLSPEEYQKQENKKNTNIDDYISAFIKEHESLDDSSLTLDEVKKIIFKFLYFTFNSDAQTVLGLIDKSRVEEKRNIT